MFERKFPDFSDDIREFREIDKIKHESWQEKQMDKVYFILNLFSRYGGRCQTSRDAEIDKDWCAKHKKLIADSMNIPVNPTTESQQDFINNLRHEIEVETQQFFAETISKINYYLAQENEKLSEHAEVRKTVNAVDDKMQELGLLLDPRSRLELAEAVTKAEKSGKQSDFEAFFKLFKKLMDGNRKNEKNLPAGTPTAKATL